MKFYKIIENEKVTLIGKSKAIPSNGVEITETEYQSLLAEIQEKAKAIADYTEKVKAGEITLADVPEEYYSEVEAIVNAPEPEEPDPRQSLVDELISEVNA